MTNCPMSTALSARTSARSLFRWNSAARPGWSRHSRPACVGEKLSKHSIPAGDVGALLSRFALLRQKEAARTGREFPMIVIQEAGLDGFWIHRILEGEGAESHVVDAASILTSR